MSEKVILNDDFEKCLMGTNWCIRCLPEKEYAQVIWHGGSYCVKCFEALAEKGVNFEPDAYAKARFGIEVKKSP